MANNTKKTALKTEVVETPVEEVVAKREFHDEDKIKCRSIVQGGLCMIGMRTKEQYDWAAYGEVIPVKYVDLATAVRTRSKFVFAPWFIVEDEDFCAEFPQLDKFYNERFTVKDLREIIDLDVDDMVEAIQSLPEGAKDSMRAIVSQAVKDGVLDSVRKIRALDELFGTDLNLLASLFQA